MNKKSFERFRLFSLPVIVVFFALIYWWLTRKVIFSVPVLNSTAKESGGVFNAIFGSPEIIKMFKVTIFYSVPIFIFMIFLYLLFSKIHRVTISLGNYKIDMEQDIANKATQIVEHVGGEYKKSLNQLSYQLDKLEDFGRILSGGSDTFEFYFKSFLNYLKEIFYYKTCDIRCAFYFIVDGQAYGYDLLGMSAIDTLKLREFLADVIALKKAGFVGDLEKRYMHIITEFECEVIHNIIGAPIILFNGEIIGVVLAYTKDDELIFSKLDADILGLLCQYLGVGLARFNLKEIFIGMYSLDGFPLEPPNDLEIS